MPYILVSDFRRGVDRSRPIYAAEAGTIWSGINGHLTRGGDFEKRKAFQAKHALPAGTFGLASATNSGNVELYVFGHGSAPAGLPTGVNYQQLAHPSGVAMRGILDVELFNGLIYAIAEYIDGAVHHFYDGTRITDWDGGANNPSQKGRVARTLQRKVYSAGDFQLSFSGTDTATGWTDGTDTGSGQINLSNHLAGSEEVTGLGVYQAKIAALSRNVIQIWLMFADPLDNVQDQVIEGTGTRAPGSVLGFGDLDLFYLSDSGVRSLRSRDITNAAGVNDVGTPIDSLIVEWMASLAESVVEVAQGIVEPVEGRYWLAIGERIFVFTYFPGKKVSAWSWYEPGFTVSDFAVIGASVYARAGDVLYRYGGDSGQVYDRCRATLQLPFLSGGKPGHYKEIEGIAIGATGSWTVDLLVDPNDEDVVEHVGELEGVTFPLEAVAHVGNHTHIAPRLIHEADGYASVSNVAIFFQGSESEGGTA